MVLVIDTSSARSALAVVEAGRALAEEVFPSGRDQELASKAAALVAPRRLRAVAVALGPGSFTGLRLGVSFGLGLAMGLGVPLLGFGSLELQAARSRVPALALVEAGRGRVHWLAPSQQIPRLGEPWELPRELPAVGWLRAATQAAVERAGVRMLSEEELESFGWAAAQLLGKARQLGYDTVRLEYMQSFGPLRA